MLTPDALYTGYTVIIGLGETGFSCVEYLAPSNLPLIVVDSRPTPPKLAALQKNYPQIPVITGNLPIDILSKADSIILSPGISKQHPDIIKAVPNGMECIGDIELFTRLLKQRAITNHTKEADVIAITGSNGKSTVTSLVGHMARTAGIQVAVGGNLGTPVLALTDAALYVLELSSFQLETTYSLKPLVATILNLCPDHLDRYPDVKHYHAAKQRIFNHCQKVVINKDDAYSSLGTPVGIPTGTFGLNTRAEFSLIAESNQDWLAHEGIPLLPVSELNILGHHNIANALAALSIGAQAGFPMEAMLNALRTFTGLPHRGEWVKKEHDIVWINDSKGTNVGATIATLTGLSSLITGKWILIAGGDGKNADFTPLQSVVSQYCRAVILIGKEPKTLNILKTLLGTVVPCQYVDSMEAAVRLAEKEARAGEGVLLSPACASYDMFRNFEERGEAFKHACTA